MDAKALAKDIAKVLKKVVQGDRVTVKVRGIAIDFAKDVAAFVEGECTKSRDIECHYKNYTKVIRALEKIVNGTRDSAKAEAVARVIEKVEERRATVMPSSARESILQGIRAGGLSDEFRATLNAALSVKPGAESASSKPSRKVGKLGNTGLDLGTSSGGMDDIKEKFKTFYKLQQGNDNVLHARLTMMGVSSEKDRARIIMEMGGDNAAGKEQVKDKLEDYAELVRDIRDFFKINGIDKLLADDLIDNVIMLKVDDMLSSSH